LHRRRNGSRVRGGQRNSASEPGLNGGGAWRRGIERRLRNPARGAHHAARLQRVLAVPKAQRAVRSLLNPNPFSARVSSGIGRVLSTSKT